MTSSNNNCINSFFNSFIQSQVIKSTEKDKAKEREMETNLVALLSKLTQTVAKAQGSAPSADGKSSGSLQDSGNQPGVPTEQQLEEAIAAAQAAIAILEGDIASTSNSELKAELEIQVAQMTNMINIMNNMIQFLKNFPSNMQNFQTWLSQQSSQFQSWWNNQGNRWVPNPEGGGEEVPYPDPLISNITQAIEQYVQQTFGITISLGSSYGSLSDIIADATNQVQAGLNQQLNEAVSKMYIQLESINNPVIEAMMNLLKQGNGITAQDLQSLEDILAQVVKVLTEEAKSSAQGNGAPSNSMVVQMLGLMAGMMNQLEGDISQSTSNKGEDDAQVAQALMQQAQLALNNAIQQANEIAQEQAEQKSDNIFMKVLEGITAAVMAVVACALGQFQMAAIVIVMAVLQESGALQDVTSAMAKDFVNDGWLSQTAAQAVADAVVVAIVMICTAGAGAAASYYTTGSLLGTTAASAATDAATTGAENSTQAAQEIEMVELNVTRTVEEGLQQGLQQAANGGMDASGGYLNLAKDIAMKVLAKLGQVLKALNPFQYIPAVINMTLSTTSQTILQSNLIVDATTATDTAKGDSASQIAHDQMVAGITGSIIMTALSAGAMGGLTSATSVESTADNCYLKFLDRFKGFLNSKMSPTTIATLYKIAQLGGGVGEATGQAVLGISYTRQAAAEVALGYDEAQATFFQELEKTTATGMTNAQTTASTILKSHEQISNAVYSTMLAYEATFAQLFSQAV